MDLSGGGLLAPSAVGTFGRHFSDRATIPTGTDEDMPQFQFGAKFSRVGPQVKRDPMLLLLVLLDVGVIGALYWMWRKALKDAGLAVVATAVCSLLVSVFSSMMVLAVM